MRGNMVLAPAMLALGLGACDSIRGWQEPLEPASAIVDKVTREKEASPTELIGRYYGHKVAQDRRDFRDQYIDKRLLAVNARFYAFTQELREGKVGTGLGGDIVKLTLSAVGAVFGSAQTKSVISAVSGAVTGATASFDKHVFYEMALPALIAQMNASRDTIIFAIRNGQKKGTEEYSLADGLEHLQRLEQAGSIEDAISKITAKATAAADAAKKEVLNADGSTDADKKYLGSEEGKKQRQTVLNRTNTADIAKVRALVDTPPDGVSNSEADKKVEEARRKLNGATPSDKEARDMLKLRIESAKRKIELEAWQKALN